MRHFPQKRVGHIFINTAVRMRRHVMFFMEHRKFGFTGGFLRWREWFARVAIHRNVFCHGFVFREGSGDLDQFLRFRRDRLSEELVMEALYRFELLLLPRQGLDPVSSLLSNHKIHWSLLIIHTFCRRHLHLLVSNFSCCILLHLLNLTAVLRLCWVVVHTIRNIEVGWGFCHGEHGAGAVDEGWLGQGVDLVQEFAGLLG